MVLLRRGCRCYRAMLHSVARAVVAAVLLIGDLSERRGLWRSDAAGTAQCGSGEAALRFLLVLALSFLLLIFSPPSSSPLLPSLLLRSSVILHRLPRSPPPHSPPALLLSSFVTTGTTFCQAVRLNALHRCSPGCLNEVTLSQSEFDVVALK